MAGTQLLPGTRGTFFNMDPTDLTVIGVDTDHKAGEHDLWDERVLLALDENMVLNIMALGVREPVIVEVEKGDGGDRKALVVDGRRRTLHAREANRRLRERGEPELRVPVIAEKNTEDKILSMLSASLNEIRLQDDTRTRSAKASRMKARGLSIDEIALAFGVTKTTVNFLLDFNGLHESVKSAVDNGQLTATAAVQLAKLPKSDQEGTLAKLISEAGERGERKVKVKHATAGVAKRDKGKEARPAPGKKVLKKVVKGGDSLPDGFVLGIRYALGEVDARAIPGLTALLKSK